MSDESQIDQPGKENECPQKREGASGNKPPNGPLISPPTSAENGPSPKNTGCTNQKKEGFLEKYKTKFEAAAIIGGLVLVALTYFQWKEVRRENLLSERAWLVASTVTIGPPENDSIQFNINYKNTGKTPAINTQIEIVSQPNFEKIPTGEQPPVPQISSGLIAPDGTGFTYIKEPIASLKGGGVFYIYGTIWYNDIFGIRHWSQYCFLVRCRISTGNIGFDIETAAIHNSCDEAETHKPKETGGLAAALLACGMVLGFGVTMIGLGWMVIQKRLLAAP